MHLIEFTEHPALLGLRGTYQGLTATVLKQGSNQAIRFFVMTSLKNWYKGQSGSGVYMSVFTCLCSQLMTQTLCSVTR